MIPKLLSNTQEHYTPRHIVDAARSVLGEIDFDPASCEEAQAVVAATEWIGLPQDGLQCPWNGRIFVNPPGGTFTARRKSATDEKPVTSADDAAHKLRWRTDSRATAWWRKLVEEHESGRVSAAIFVGFNLEIVRSAQGEEEWSDPLEHPFCVPKERICFGGDRPTHANVIVYLGPKRRLFERVFSPIGRVRV